MHSINKVTNGYLTVDNLHHYEYKMTKRRKFPENWIRHFRKKNEMSADTLGKLIGMTGIAITYMERGERGLTIENAKRIADVFEVHYIEIIDGPTDALVTKNQREAAHLALYREFSEKDQERFSDMATAFSNAETKKKDKQTKEND